MHTSCAEALHKPDDTTMHPHPHPGTTAKLMEPTPKGQLGMGQCSSTKPKHSLIMTPFLVNPPTNRTKSPTSHPDPMTCRKVPTQVPHGDRNLPKDSQRYVTTKARAPADWSSEGLYRSLQQRGAASLVAGGNYKTLTA